MTINPMQSPPKPLPMHKSKRCRAKSKRSKVRCKAPAVRGLDVCRMHGAGGGAPKGPTNGNYRTGFHTGEAKANGRALRDCVREIRAITGAR